MINGFKMLQVILMETHSKEHCINTVTYYLKLKGVKGVNPFRIHIFPTVISKENCSSSVTYLS